MGSFATSVLWHRGVVRFLLMAGMIVCLTACGGGDNNGTTVDPIVAAIHPSGTQSAADLVRLTGTTAGDVAVVSVAIGGPTTSDDLYAFAFDLTISDTSVLTYVNGSAALGNALTLDAGEDAEVLAVQNGDRVTVGVSKLGAASGNGVTIAEATVVSLRFRVLRRDRVSSLAIAGFAPDDPAALDSTGTAIGSVTFDGASLGVSGS
jgi:hypothetical protein